MSMNRIGTNGAAGVSLYCRPWKMGRPKRFLGFSGTVPIVLPSRWMMKCARPLSRSASACHVSTLPFNFKSVGAGGGVRSRALDFGGHYYAAGEVYRWHFFARGDAAATVAVALVDSATGKTLATQTPAWRCENKWDYACQML